MEVIIRDLRVEDAEVSWKWRNDPEVWKNTKISWTDYVTKEVEEAWIKDVISRKDEKRFAICVVEAGIQKYVGNACLNNITQDDAEYHIFIGNKEYWNKGVGQKTQQLVDEYARNVLHLKRLYAWVKIINKASLAVLAKNNWTYIKEQDGYAYVKIDL